MIYELLVLPSPIIRGTVERNYTAVYELLRSRFPNNISLYHSLHEVRDAKNGKIISELNYYWTIESPDQKELERKKRAIETALRRLNCDGKVTFVTNRINQP